MCKRKSYLKEICTEKIYFKFFKNKPAKFINSDMEKKCSESSDASSNCSDIEEEVTKQMNMLKPFDMEPRKAIPNKIFVSEKENCQEEINLTPQDRIGNIDLTKSGCERKPMATFAKSLCILVRLNPQSMMGASHYSAFMGNCPIISHTGCLTYLVDEFFFLFLVYLNKMRTLGEFKFLSFCFWFEGGENFQNFHVLPQGFGNFPTVFSRARCRNSVRVGCL